MNPFARTNKSNIAIKEMGISFQTVVDCTVIGKISPTIPRITNKLKLLLPITFPKTMSDWWSKEAIELTTNSGADVPKATIVNPIAKSEILFFFAREEAPLTIQSAPFIKNRKPTIINMLEITIDINFNL